MAKVNWSRVVVSVVLASWIGHVYGLVRYHKTLALYSRQSVLRYLNELQGALPRVSPADQWLWAGVAGLAGFVSVWLLLKAQEIARRH